MSDTAATLEFAGFKIVHLVSGLAPHDGGIDVGRHDWQHWLVEDVNVVLNQIESLHHKRTV